MVKLAVDFSPKCTSVRNYFQNQVSVGTLLKVKAKWVHRGKQALSHVRQKQP